MSENPAVHTKEWAKRTGGKYNTSVLVPHWARDPHPGELGDRLAALSFADRCLLGDAICRLGTRRLAARLLESQPGQAPRLRVEHVLTEILREAKESDGPPFQGGYAPSLVLCDGVVKSGVEGTPGGSDDDR